MATDTAAVGESGSERGSGTWRRAVDWNRAAATAGVGLVVLAYLRVLYGLAAVAGRPAALVGVAGAAVVGGTVLARSSSRRTAVFAAGIALGAGGFAYFQSLPAEWTPWTVVTASLGSLLSFATGGSVLTVVNVGVWLLVAAPVPTFLAWYLAVRRRFVPAVVVAGSVLGLLVLSGDAGPATTALGVVGGLAAIGFADITAGTGPGVDRARRALLVELGAVAAAAQVLPVVPDGAGRPVSVLDGPAGEETLEGTLTRDGALELAGDLSLSAEVRFLVTAPEARYWRVGAYDRYTGRGWERTREPTGYGGRLPTPPGPSRELEQSVTVRSELDVLPAAWKPRELAGVEGSVSVGPEGGLRPAGSLSPGASYTVHSAVPAAERATLRDAGDTYPPRVRERYTQVPPETPERVGQLAREVTDGVTGPYDTARAVADWLVANKRYSLSVERPAGDVVDAFLFGMEAGYCTYFATAMATMLRTVGVPARFVSGYTPGQRAGDRWVVRGYDAHAWVEVYVPGHGWVDFDPTPAGPRRRAQQERLARARASGEPGVDAAGSQADDPADQPVLTPSPAPTPTATAAGTAGDTDRANATREDPENRTTAPPTATGRAGRSAPGNTSALAADEGSGLPSPEEVGLGVVVLAGLGAGARSAGLTERAYRAAWLRVQPRRAPEADIERAYERLEYLLSRRHGPRRTGETASQYLARVGDDRAHRVGELYQRARYGGGVGRAAADEAVSLVDELVGERG